MHIIFMLLNWINYKLWYKLIKFTIKTLEACNVFCQKYIYTLFDYYSILWCLGQTLRDIFLIHKNLRHNICLSSCLVDRLFLLYVVMFIVQWLFHKNKLSWLFCPSSFIIKGLENLSPGKANAVNFYAINISGIRLWGQPSFLSLETLS